MAEELGKITKPAASEFSNGRKLFFVPLVYCPKEAPQEYLQLYEKYWRQVESQLSGLEAKLGKVDRFYHELVTEGGEAGTKIIKEMNDRAFLLIEVRRDETAVLEATEDAEILSEFIDWNRCLSIGLQNKRVFTTVYQGYVEASKKRDEFIVKRITDTLKENEIGLFLFTDGHPLQFPADINVFYVAPPALDEIKRLIRDDEAKAAAEANAAEDADKQR